MSAQDFADLIRREFQQPGYRSAPIHENIYNLDASIVISPNFDNIYDTYASTTSSGTLMVKDHTDTDIINYLVGGETRLLLKTHGTVNSPHDIIFTRSGYARARTKYVLFYEIIRSLILTHRFLFLGCGIDDPDIRAMFEDVQFAHDGMPFHYMTMPSGEIPDEVLSVVGATMKIRFLQYSANDGHQELTDSLSDLVQKVDAFREQKASDQKW